LRTNNSVLEASPKEVDPSRDSMSLFVMPLEEKQPMEKKLEMPPVKEMQPLEEKREKLTVNTIHPMKQKQESAPEVRSAQREEGAGVEAGGVCIYRTTEI
jgi:hypothetical protein